MKTVSRILCGAIIFFAAESANAQVSATASASATIITPIAISKHTDMNFGNVAVQAGTGGTVVLAASNTASRTTGGAGGVTLPASAGTVAAAAFDVTGDNSRTYAITLPASATITSGSNNMTVNAFTSDQTSNIGTLSSSGAQTFYVGATLNVASGQAVGTYSGNFSVTVNYN